MVWPIFDEKQVEAIRQIIASKSELITVVLGAALLDRSLRYTIEKRLMIDDDISNKLFKVSGALGNLGPKIDLLWLMGAFDKQTRNALYGIAAIRNFFAHNLNATLDTPDKKLLEDGVGNLILHRNRSYYPALFGSDSDAPLMAIHSSRDLFIVNLQLGLHALMQDRVNHKPHSFEPQTKEEFLVRRQEATDPDAGEP
jgi:hypothetical protein